MIKPGIYAKPFNNQDPFLLADRRGQGWHFCLDRDGPGGDYPVRNGGWSIKWDKSDYDNCNMIMPFNLWVF